MILPKIDSDRRFRDTGSGAHLHSGVGQAALVNQYTIPLLVPADTWSELQGMLRILNSTHESRTVVIFAIDGGSQTRSTPTMSSSSSGLNSAIVMEEPSHKALRVPGRGMRRFKSAIQ